MRWGRDWSESRGALGVIRRRGDGVVPSTVAINHVLYLENEAYFKAVIAEAPDVFVVTSEDPARKDESKVRDAWGSLWHFPGDYLDGQVIGHPLANWQAWPSYVAPDPADYTDWDAARERIARAKCEGRLGVGGVEHGFLYLRLQYLRGFENLMLDIADLRPELFELIETVTDYWSEVVRRWLDIGVDVVQFADDLGHQASLPMRPDTWRRLILPAYERLFAPCRQQGVEVYLHTDGYILDIIPDLIDAGITVLNPQDLVNGLGNLRHLAWGKVAVDLDIDRQSITVFGTPEEIDRHVASCVRTLGSPSGGLMLVFGAYPGTPAENVGAVIRAMQTYHCFGAVPADRTAEPPSD